MALLDHREADRLREMTLAGAGRAQKEGIIVLGHVARGGELVDEGPVHLLVEVEVEGVQALADVTEAGLGEPAVEQAILPADEFVLHEAGKEVDRGKLLGLGFEQPGSRPVAIPEQRSWRRARCTSSTFTA